MTLYVSYIINPWLRNLNADFMLNNCLFGSAKLAKNDDLDKCEYTGYSIGFHSRSEYLFTDRSMGKVIICGAEVSSPASVHID